MNNIVNFLKASYDELVHHMTWLTWAQLQKYSLIILVFMIIFSLLVWAMDITSSNGMQIVYSVFQ